MQAQQLTIPAVLLCRVQRFGDQRGWFMETYNAAAYVAAGVDAVFVQDNHSLSVPRGTVRGLHFQVPPKPQAKLVRVTRGAIYDVAVDLRAGSPHYGQWCAATLTAKGAEQLYIPAGFAHGFCTIEPDTEVCYKVDGLYAPDCDAGLKWDDPTLSIDWPLAGIEPVVSAKDAALPSFDGFQSPFRMGASA